MNTEHKDLTVQQTAELFQTTPKTIYERLKDGTLDSYLIGSQRRVKYESVQKVRGK